MNSWKTFKPLPCLLACLHALLFTAPIVSAGPLPQAVQQLDFGKKSNFDGMRAAVKTLSDVQSKAVTEKKIDLALQQLILTKSGECIRAAAKRHQNGTPLSPKAKKAARQLHLDLSTVIGNILRLNEETISDLQENTLDQLKDPAAFLNSPRWQGPQQLITLASYWLGWNGYYGSLAIPEKDPSYRGLLNEAVKGFSRAFVDAKEDAAISSSLFGRGLCYSRLDAYEKARKDFKSVRTRTGKGDPLFLRCLYEDVRIIYRSGNYETAQRRIDEILEDFQKENIPDEIATGLENIRSKVLVALLKKQGESDKNGTIASSQKNMDLFARARQSAVHPAAVPDFYRYVQENAPALEYRSFDKLGPVAYMALGDLSFERQDYDRALDYYHPVMDDFPPYLTAYKDGVWFRTAYGHSKKERWGDAVLLLDQFHSKFKDSSLTRQAADLYFAAAAHHYDESKSEQAQQHFINAAGIYIRQYRGKERELNKARFTLAKHYQETGHLQKAADQFGLVTQDSPNYHAAQHHLIQYHVKALENLESKGESRSSTAMEIYKTGLQRLKQYKSVVEQHKSKTAHKQIKPWLAILESQLLMHGPEKNYQRILNLLKPLDKQMPQLDAMHLQALRLRLSCYHHLNMPERIENEMARLSIAGPLKKNGCEAIYRLGNRHYRQGAHLMKTEAPAKAHRNWTTALIIFNKLDDMLSTCPDPEPYNESLKLKMAIIYMHKDQLELAEALYQDILAINAMSADAVYNLGMLYEKKQQWAQALGIWRKFSNGVEAGTYHWYESRYKTAAAHIRLGNPQKACDILTITLVLHPDFGKEELKEKYLDLKSKICQ